MPVECRSMLVLEHISKAFDGRMVLSDVSLSVPRGATCALIGSSGSGKTTLLRITLRLIALDQGSVKINDQQLTDFDAEAWADQIGYVPQDGGLFPHLTGRQNVALVPRLRHWPQDRIEARLAELQRLDPILRPVTHPGDERDVLPAGKMRKQ